MTTLDDLFSRYKIKHPDIESLRLYDSSSTQAPHTLFVNGRELSGPWMIEIIVDGKTVKIIEGDRIVTLDIDGDVIDRGDHIEHDLHTM